VRDKFAGRRRALANTFQRADVVGMESQTFEVAREEWVLE
jgi:hypothetical protein